MEKQQTKTIWHIQEGTLHTARKAQALRRAIEAACTVLPEDESRMINYTYFLANTTKIEPPPTARASLRALAAFIPTWEDLAPAQVWEFYQKELSANVVLEWDSEFTKAQNPYDTDPAELPLDALSDEQKVEAATPGTPLTSPGKSLPAK